MPLADAFKQRDHAIAWVEAAERFGLWSTVLYSTVADDTPAYRVAAWDHWPTSTEIGRWLAETERGNT